MIFHFNKYNFQYNSTNFNSNIFEVQNRDDYGHNGATYETGDDPTMPSEGWDDGAGEGHEFEGEAGCEFEVEEEFGAEERVYGEPEADYQLGTQIEDEMGPYEPYEESTKALESPHFALDTPFVDYTYAKPAQWVYGEPEVDYQLGTRIEDEMGPYKPYEESTEALEGPPLHSGHPLHRLHVH